MRRDRGSISIIHNLRGMLKKYLAYFVVLASCFLLGGGIYLLVYRPGIFIRGAGGLGVTFIYRGDTLSQLTLEGFFVGFMYLIALTGLFIMVRSRRFIDNPSRMTRDFFIGFSLAIIGSLLIFMIGYWKVPYLYGRIFGI
ncbi:MAG TPA: hypothetical protein ENF41_00260 [Candidatus Bathyarchaeota archaeon]|nr:hypothetical protein [Candidatus Bathyarchaeota archaeon]